MADYRPRCTKEFRKALLDKYPQLQNKPEYLRMMYYLLFPHHVEESTSQPIITRKTLASIEGKRQQIASHNYKGKRFLERFRNEVLPGFKYSDWDYQGKKARVAIETGLDTDDAKALRDLHYDSLTDSKAEWVYVDTGTTFTRQAQADHRKEILEAVRVTTTIHEHNLAYRNNQKIVDYQNNLSVSLFTRKVNANKAGALAYFKGMPDGPSKRHAATCMTHILSQPQPFIQPVARSDRPFSVEPSLLTINRELRKILTRDWYEYDLRSAQFAIIATYWNVPEVQDFLNTGESLWRHLATALGEDLEARKPVIKEAVYSLVFGAAKKTIIALLTAGISEKAAKGFFKIPLIKVVYQARQEQIRAAMVDGYLDTIFENRIDVRSKFDARSALARQAQAVEVALILPIYELAETTNEFRVVLYSFDGVTIAYNHPNTAKAWEKRIKAAVKAKADSLGVNTVLEGEKLK